MPTENIESPPTSEPVTEDIQVEVDNAETNEILSDVVELLEEQNENYETEKIEEEELLEEEKKELEISESAETDISNENSENINSIADNTSELIKTVDSLELQPSYQDQILEIQNTLNSLLEQSIEINQIISIYGLIVIPAIVILYALWKMIKPFL